MTSQPSVLCVTCGPRQTLLSHLALLFLVLLTACARQLPGEKVPANGVYFPGAMTSTNTGALLHVVSTNFDLRHTSGWITTFDVDQLVAALEVESGGQQALEQAETQQLKIPSLGGAIALSPNGSLLAIGARGEQPVTLVDVVDGALSCGDAKAQAGLDDELRRTDCDEDHYLDADERVVGNIDFQSLNARPFADPYAVVFVNDTTLAIGYLGTEYLAVVERQGDGTFVGTAGAVLQAGAFDAVSTLSLWRSPQDGIQRLIATTRFTGTPGYSPTAAVLALNTENLPSAAAGERTPFQRQGVQAADLVGPVFSKDGNFMYAVADSPPALFVLDARLGTYRGSTEQTPFTQPRFTTLSSISLPGRPTGTVLLPDGETLVVTALEDDAVYIVRLTNLSPRVARVLGPVCAGPFSATLVGNQTADRAAGRSFVAIGCFFDNTVRLLDVSGADASGYFMVEGGS